ncbi:MAG: GNAT family N-acetyltransferase, partial [Flavobacteriaceae bacterium]|nr:GNAT family N-acetyltransferase [Flavobacteriaceae bacterium]
MTVTNSSQRLAIRQAEDADLCCLRKLRQDFFQTQLDAGLLDVPVNLEQMLDISTPSIAKGRRQFCFIAEFGGELAGYVTAVMRMVPGLAQKSVGSIEELYVSPSLRGTGAASSLVGEAVDALRQEGAERIQ